jgi:hypothetical protein
LDENNKYFEEEILFKNIFRACNNEKRGQNPPNPPPAVSFFLIKKSILPEMKSEFCPSSIPKVERE